MRHNFFSVTGEDRRVRVVVMGCGRVGAALADSLSRIGHEVAVIDREATAFHRLTPDFSGERVLGMGFDRDVLLRAGIEEAGAFAAVSSGDNSNIISARVARETFGVERVVARIYDAKRAAVYERLGIPTVATVPWSTDRLMRMLLPDGVASAWREPTGTVAILPLPVHEEWVGHPISELEGAAGCRVAFIVRFGTGVLPGPETAVQAEDTLYVAAVSGTVSDVTAAASAPPQEG
jgi:trk system potassium uptake protein TrkA